MECLTYEDITLPKYTVESLLDYYESRVKELEDHLEYLNGKELWELREHNRPELIECMKEVEKLKRIKAVLELRDTLSSLRDKVEKVMKNGDESWVISYLRFRDIRWATELLLNLKRN